MTDRCKTAYGTLGCILDTGHAGPHKHRTTTVFIWWQQERR